MKTEIGFLFTASVIAALYFLYRAMRHPSLIKYFKIVFPILILWLVLQGVLAFQGFYLNHFFSTPPRFPFLVAPAFTCVLLLILIPSSRNKLLLFDNKSILMVHTLRIPIEIVLLLMYQQKLIPQSMTFEGFNFDILSGIAALGLLLAGKKYNENKKILVAFNSMGLILVLAIVAQAILSVPGPMQQINFEQPNVGVFHFPLVWLPCFLVPFVILLHLVAFIKLKNKSSD